MAVSNLAIVQSNIDECELLAVHNPLTFLLDATYTGTAPEVCTCEVWADGSLINTYKLIPYSDFLSTRRFCFVGDVILRSYMSDFNDELITEKTLTRVENMTKDFTLIFKCEATEREIDITALHGAVQYGEVPALLPIYNNENETYIGGAGQPIYIYFYNKNDGDILTINSPFYDDAALDYDEYWFTDFDEFIFKL
jgi:hypothetical protein